MSLRPTRLIGAIAAVGAVAAVAAVPLTASPAAATGPTLTRQSIVYTADTDGDFYYGIYAASESNPSSRVAILPEADPASPDIPTDVLDARVSPDGTKVAAEVDREGNGDYSLEVIDVATGAHTLIQAATSSYNPNDELVAGTFITGMDWSRDSSTVVYSVETYNASSATPRVYALWTRAADASTAGAALSGGDGLSSPSYSQDGTQIVATDLFGASPGLYRLPAAGGASTLVHAASGVGVRWQSPTWSLDDTTIVATLEQPNNSIGLPSSGDLYSVSATDSSAAPALIIKNTSTIYQRPAFGMDGSLWFDTISSDPAKCCSGDLYQAHRNSAGGWTITNRTPTANVDEGGVSLMRPADDGAPTSAATLIAPLLTGDVSNSAVIRWTIPAGFDDYAYVKLQRIDVTSDPDGLSPTTIDHAFGTSYRDLNLTLGHDYTYAITEIYDGSGNKLSPGMTNAQPIKLRASGVKIVSANPSSTLSAGLPFRVSWSLPGQPAGSVTYDVKYGVRTSTSNFQTIGSIHYFKSCCTTAITDMFKLADAGQTYYFSATVHDPYGNYTTTSWFPVNVPLDQKSGVFSKGWTTAAFSADWLGSIAATSVNGSSVSFTTISKAASVLGDKGPVNGKFAVYVDNHYKGTFSSYAKSLSHRQPLWSGTLGATNAKHVVKIVAILAKGQVLRVDGLADPR